MCTRAFRTKAALATHMYRSHGLKNQVRRLASTTHCLCCLVEFHSRERLVYHLAQAIKCSAWFNANMAPMTPEAAEALDKASANEQLALGRNDMHLRRALRT